MNQTASQPIDFREYARVLRKYKWMIILVIALVIGTVMVVSIRKTPLYTATARVFVEAIPTGTTSSAPLLPPVLETERELAQSLPVATEVRERLNVEQPAGLLLGPLTVAGVTNTSVLTFSYTSPDPTFAADAANAFAQGYIDYRRDEALTDLLAVEASIQSRVENTSEELTELNEQIAKARKAGDEGLASSLESQRSVLQARLGVLQERLDDLQPDRAVRLGGGEIIMPAAVPTKPSSPDFLKNGLLAAFLGIALGIGLAFLRERLDNRFRERGVVERVLSVPVLGTVPVFKRPRQQRNRLIVESDPQGKAAESYRSLRTNLEFAMAEHGSTSILITSPAAGEGKTATAANLALTLSQSGRRTILVSGDLRRPTLDKLFGVESPKGLSTWLIGRAELTDVIHHSGFPNLRVVPSGPIPQSPAELLTSPRLQQLIHQLQSVADVVVVDAPPVLPVADASILASRVQGTLLVLHSKTTHQSAALHAREELARVGARLIGVVLNGFDPPTSPYYYAGYSGYSADVPPAAVDVGADSPASEDPRRSKFSLRR